MRLNLASATWNPVLQNKVQIYNISARININIYFDWNDHIFIHNSYWRNVVI